jgi:diguanylate cyclase (GGDEF)-like protein
MIKRQLNSRVIHDLKKRSSIGIIFYVVLSFIVVFEKGYYFRNTGFSLTFLCSLNAICLARVIHLRFFRRLEAFNERLNTTIFVATVLLTASVWGGAFGYSIQQEGEFTSRMLMAICMAGLSAGGVVAFIPLRSLSIVFNLLMLVPSMVLLTIKGGDTGLVIMIISYSIYLILLTLRGNKEYWYALENEKKLEEKTIELRRLSHTDPLTGLYNRRYFSEIFDFEWKRAIRDKTSLTVVMCDIDHFKRVNDTHGHIAGDEYLIDISRVLRNKFKRDTDIVARYGGEEFVILLSGIDDEDVFRMTESLRKQTMDHKVHFDNAEIRTTVSVGAASCFPDPKGSPEHLIARADRALYRAKENGRNRVEIDSPGYVA